MPLKIDTRVPYANVGNPTVAVLGEGHLAEVRFTAHPHGGPEALWFCFRIVRTASSVPTPPRVRLVLEHPDNLLGGAGGEMAITIRPVFRVDTGGDGIADDVEWKRLPAPEVEYLPDGRRALAWIVDAPPHWMDVAACYPYGQPELGKLLVDTGDAWRSDVIGLSQGGRPITRLCNDYGLSSATATKPPGVYVIARQHSGETPGSWVLDGFLRELADARQQGKPAPAVWAVPLSNGDGIEQGDYGKDNFPYDLNRAWGRPAMRHETHVMKADVRRWASRTTPTLAIDFHAPGYAEGDGLYLFAPDPAKDRDAAKRVRPWAEALREHLGALAAGAAPTGRGEFARVANYPSRWETPNFARFIADELNAPAISLEVPYAFAGDLLLSPPDYQEAGRRIARAVMQQLSAAAKA
jgi:hypothetical protein